MSRAHRFATNHFQIEGRPSRPVLSFLSTLTFLGLGFSSFWGCSSETATPNRPPTVELTAGPTEGDTVRYNVPISWSGEDPDGSIVRYEYAIDPDSGFSEDEIANGGPGIVSTFVKGKNGAPDTTRVSKGAVSFDWIHTTETSRRFQFSTPNADSVFVEGSITPTGRFYGLHTVYVRAVDDDEAVSAPDKVAFTAKTIAPRSWITRPIIGNSFLGLGDTLHVAWKGFDRDGLSRQPVGFLIALVPDPCENLICLIPTPISFLFHANWRFISADSLNADLPLMDHHLFLFGVRAVDANGAIEPFLDEGRNAFRFAVLPGARQPTLSISYAGQVFTFPTTSGPSPLQIPAERRLIFELSCSAESYGESCDGFRWSLDDPENWTSDWSSDTQIRLNLHSGTHLLYVEARDTLGNTTLATLILNGIAFTFEREVLMVDDSFDNLDPNDAEHDDFWRDMINFYVANSDVTADQFGVFEVHGPGDRGNLQPNAPLLSDLAKYKLLVWENLGSGYNSDSALIRSTALSSRLSAYMQAGGKLWLGGRMTVAATTPDPNLAGADLTYPKTELGPGDWAWDFLKLHSSKINNDKGTDNRNLFHAARWFPGVPAIYDTMSVDVSKLRLLWRALSGFAHADAVFDPNFAESEPAFRGDIDTLYAYGASGPEVLGKTSQYHNRLCALRWHDPDPDREHGRIQWFGFSLYFMHQDQARNTFKASLDWLREESPAP